VVERTVPILRALVNLDKDGVYYKTKAKLAYALKDKQAPTAEDLQGPSPDGSHRAARSPLRDDPALRVQPRHLPHHAGREFQAGKMFVAGGSGAHYHRSHAAAPLLQHKFGDRPIAPWRALNTSSEALNMQPRIDRAETASAPIATQLAVHTTAKAS
jgi:hypothetical protein